LSYRENVACRLAALRTKHPDGVRLCSPVELLEVIERTKTGSCKITQSEKAATEITEQEEIIKVRDEGCTLKSLIVDFSALIISVFSVTSVAGSFQLE
jgi:hypothetical protein